MIYSTEIFFSMFLAVYVLKTERRPDGVTLIAATLVIPATVARMLTNSFSRMLFLAAAIGALSGLVGMNVSYHADVQTGPSIVLVAAGMFVAVLTVTGVRGLSRARGALR